MTTLQASASTGASSSHPISSNNKNKKVKSKHSLTVSAPGKILLAGGYLVLEHPNVGLVLAVDQRFYATITRESHVANLVSTRNNLIDSTDNSTKDNVVHISVKSPQFQNQIWEYEFNWQSLQILQVFTTTDTSKNDFIEKTLYISLLYLQSVATTAVKYTKRIDIVIRADNAFYSLVPHLSGKERTWQNVNALPKFLPAATTTGGRVLKTGLGSSACLVTSIVGALCAAYLPSRDDDNNQQQQPTLLVDDSNTDDTNNDNERANTIYNLCQLCHCYAQGKVGSGFDVSAACNGSHIFVRNPRYILDNLLRLVESNSSHDHNKKDDDTHDDSTRSNNDLCQLLQSEIEQKWPDGVIKALPKMPFCLQVTLADVSGGSESPSMASKVLQWKKEQHEKLSSLNQNDNNVHITHWSNLIEINKRIVKTWTDLCEWQENNSNNQYASTSLTLIDKLATLPAVEWKNDADLNESSLVHQLLTLRQAFLDARYHLRSMGDSITTTNSIDNSSDTTLPIEPPSQTALADATMALPGVLAALVPGAGGYDAMACVYIDDDRVEESISNLWSQWEWQDDDNDKGQKSVCPLGVKSITGTTNAGGGIIVEESIHKSK